MESTRDVADVRTTLSARGSGGFAEKKERIGREREAIRSLRRFVASDAERAGSRSYWGELSFNHVWV